MRNYNSQPNVPQPQRQHQYDPSDLVELVQDDRSDPAGRSVSMREAIPGINVPGPGETWQDIADFRAKWCLPPITR